MALFAKKCAWCGMKVDGGGVERMGQQFCSESHANSYMDQMRAQTVPAATQHGGGGCC